ncbi:MAG: histidine phosphatase family protein [Dehalococcoidia bacterium]
MALVYLVRHAESLVNAGTPPATWELTESGRAGAARLAELSEWKGLALVASSNEPKAMQTAEPIATRWRRPLEVDDRLREVERPWAETPGQLEEALGDYLRGGAQPGWEPISEAANRFAAAIGEITAMTTGDIAVVSHGTVLSVYLSRVLGLRVRAADWARIAMPDVCVVDPSRRRVLRDWGHTRF